MTGFFEKPNTNEGRELNTNEEKEILALAKNLANEGLRGDDELHDEIIGFAQMLQKRYPDYFRYKLYHALSGSTPTEASDLFDFPGDDSIEHFVKEAFRRRNA